MPKAFIKIQFKAQTTITNSAVLLKNSDKLPSKNISPPLKIPPKKIRQKELSAKLLKTHMLTTSTSYSRKIWLINKLNFSSSLQKRQIYFYKKKKTVKSSITTLSNWSKVSPKILALSTKISSEAKIPSPVHSRGNPKTQKTINLSTVSTFLKKWRTIFNSLKDPEAKH